MDGQKKVARSHSEAEAYEHSRPTGCTLEQREWKETRHEA